MKNLIIVCLFTRLVFAVSTIYIRQRWVSAITILATLGFLYKHVTKSGSVSGSYVWWNDWRLAHAIAYGCFSILRISGFSYSHIPLFVDFMLAVVAFAMNA